jgi:hypothetical protein
MSAWGEMDSVLAHASMSGVCRLFIASSRMVIYFLNSLLWQVFRLTVIFKSFKPSKIPTELLICQCKTAGFSVNASPVQRELLRYIKIEWGGFLRFVFKNN